MISEKPRNSNIELLRIIAMIMIVSYHCYIHGVIQILFDSPYVTWINGIEYNKFLATLYAPGGDTGVALFFIITGYFLSTKHNNILRTRNMVLETLFYSWLMTIISIITIILGYVPSGYTANQLINQVMKSFLSPLSGDVIWFTTAYLAVLLLSQPLNQLLWKLNGKGWRLLLTIACVCWYYVGIDHGGPYNGITRGVFFYIVGGLIRFEQPFEKVEKENKRHWISISIAGWMLFSLCTYIYYQWDAMHLSITSLRIWPYLIYFKTVFLTPIIAGYLFKFFLNTEIKYSGRINKIATTTYGVYLIHDTNLLREFLWKRIFKIDIQFQNWWYFFLSMVPTIVVFIAASFFDIFRQKYIEPHYQKIAEKLFIIFKRDMLKNDKN